MSDAKFFSPEWADAARAALVAGPSEAAKEGKLQEYWDFYDFIKSVYPASLGARLPEPAGRARQGAGVPARPVGRRYRRRVPDHRAG